MFTTIEEYKETLSSQQQKALSLLGAGVAAEAVAATIGVTPSYISQLISDENFAEAVSTLRYESMQKHNVRDNKYDELEDALIDQFNTIRHSIMRPMELVRSLQVINAAKRRGASTPEHITNKSTQVVLNMPTQIIQKFSTNINNQVIQVSGQELLTIDSKALLAAAGKQNDKLAITETTGSATNQS